MNFRYAFTNAGIKVSSADTYETVYTAPANTDPERSASVHTLYFTNVDSTDKENPIYINLRVYIVNQGQSFKIGHALEIPYGLTLTFDKAVNLSPGDYVEVSCDRADALEAFVSVVEADITNS